MLAAIGIGGCITIIRARTGGQASDQVASRLVSRTDAMTGIG
jgi:hypothetical protein